MSDDFINTEPIQPIECCPSGCINRNFCSSSVFSFAGNLWL